MSLVSQKRGKLLVSDTFAPSYAVLPLVEAGTVAAQAAERKLSKYLHLATNHIFTPVAIETSGVLGPESKNFVRELGHQMEQVTGDPNSLHYLLQQLSIAVQWGAN